MTKVEKSFRSGIFVFVYFDFSFLRSKGGFFFYFALLDLSGSNFFYNFFFICSLGSESLIVDRFSLDAFVIDGWLEEDTDLQINYLA